MIASRCLIAALCVVPLVSVSARAQQTMEPARVAAVAAGRATFRQFCSPCHGVDARGDGPVGRLLLAKPSDLTHVAQRNHGQFPKDRITEALSVGVRMETEAHGSDQMPIWGPVFRTIDSSPEQVAQRIDNLIAYLESIQE